MFYWNCDLKLPGYLQNIQENYFRSLSFYKLYFSLDSHIWELWDFIDNINNLLSGNFNKQAAVERKENHNNYLRQKAENEINQGQEFIRQKYYSIPEA